MRFPRRRPLVAVLLLTSLARADAPPSPVRVETISRTNPAQKLFVARVDLADPRVSLAVVAAGPDPDGPGPWETTLAPVRTIAQAADLDLAVNTVFFAHAPTGGDAKKYQTGEPASALNAVVVDGRPATPNTGGVTLTFDRQNHATIAKGPAPAGAWQAAGGSVRLLDAGRNTAGDAPARHPRTAAGLTADGRTLVIVVADGRRPGWASGLTLSELAEEMLRLGCRDAINFDGGGSSTLVARTAGRWKVLNTPSDGSTFVVPLSVERPVPYVLGVRVRRTTEPRP